MCRSEVTTRGRLSVRALDWWRRGTVDVCLLAAAAAALLIEGESWLVGITQLLSATSFGLNQASLQDSLVP